MALDAPAVGGDRLAVRPGARPHLVRAGVGDRRHEAHQHQYEHPCAAHRTRKIARGRPPPTPLRRGAASVGGPSVESMIRPIALAAALIALSARAPAAAQAAPKSCQREGAELLAASGSARVVSVKEKAQNSETRRDRIYGCWTATGRRFTLFLQRDFGLDLIERADIEIVGGRYIGGHPGLRGRRLGVTHGGDVGRAGARSRSATPSRATRSPSATSAASRTRPSSATAVSPTRATAACGSPTTRAIANWSPKARRSVSSRCRRQQPRLRPAAVLDRGHHAQVTGALSESASSARKASAGTGRENRNPDRAGNRTSAAPPPARAAGSPRPRA